MLIDILHWLDIGTSFEGAWVSDHWGVLLSLCCALLLLYPVLVVMLKREAQFKETE